MTINSIIISVIISISIVKIIAMNTTIRSTIEKYYLVSHEMECVLL